MVAMEKVRQIRDGIQSSCTNQGIQVFIHMHKLKKKITETDQCTEKEYENEKKKQKK